MLVTRRIYRTWTAEQLMQAHGRLAEGWSYTKVGRALGKTRGSVASIVKRYELHDPELTLETIQGRLAPTLTFEWKEEHRYVNMRGWL